MVGLAVSYRHPIIGTSGDSPTLVGISSMCIGDGPLPFSYTRVTSHQQDYKVDISIVMSRI